MDPRLSRPSDAAGGILKEKSSEWVKIQHPSKIVLRDRMVEVYWLSVEQEIPLLVKTLGVWQNENFADVHGDNEVLKMEDINGFRAFVERAVGKPRSQKEYVC